MEPDTEIHCQIPGLHLGNPGKGRGVMSKGCQDHEWGIFRDSWIKLFGKHDLQTNSCGATIWRNETLCMRETIVYLGLSEEALAMGIESITATQARLLELIPYSGRSCSVLMKCGVALSWYNLMCQTLLIFSWERSKLRLLGIAERVPEVVFLCNKIGE